MPSTYLFRRSFPAIFSILIGLTFVNFGCKGKAPEGDLTKCKGCDALKALQYDPQVTNKSKKVVNQANVHLKAQHLAEKTMRKKGKAYRNANAIDFVDSSSQVYVNFYLSNAHLQKFCRRQHGMKVSTERRKGRVHALASADHKNRAGAASFDQIRDLALVIDKVELHHQAGGKFYPEFNQPQVEFNDINDEAPKKLSFGSVPVGTYTKLTVYLKPTGSATENGQVITVDLLGKFDSRVDKQFIDEQLPDTDLIDKNQHFTLKSGKQYNLYLEFDVLDSLARSANGVRVQPARSWIQRLEAVEPELVQMRERQIVFKLKKDTTPEAALDMVNRLGLMPFKFVPGPNIIQAYINDDASLMDAYADVLGDPGVAMADFNFLARSANYADEPQFATQKDSLAQVGLPNAWQLNSGSGVKVAVVDTGIDTTNQDVSSAYTDWVDVLAGDITSSDLNGHGTEVASIIAGAHNGFGVAGINPNARVIAIKALNGAGTGDYVSMSLALMAAYAKGAKIINMSFGGYLDSPILAETVKHLANEGVILIGAAGNDSTSLPVYPASYASVISVAATGIGNQLADFSNFGETVDIAAPGQNVTVTGLKGNAARRSGTSYAAAYVSGVLSLVVSENSGLNLTGVTDLLQNTSDYVGRNHQNRDMGAGRINALRLLQRMKGANYTDLSVGEIWPIRRSAIEMTNSPLRLIVENRGTAASQPSIAKVKPEDSTETTVVIPSLAAGERKEFLLDYTAQKSIDGVKGVQARLIQPDDDASNNLLELHMPIVSSLGEDVLFARPKAVVIQSEPDKVQLKFSQPILNVGTATYSNFTLRLYEIVNNAEQLVQTVDVGQLASGEEKFIHFFAEKPFTSEVTKRGTYLIRGTIPDANQANNWSMTTLEIGRDNGSGVSILHKEKVHKAIAISVVDNYLRTAFAPLGAPVVESLIGELGAYRGDIDYGECVEDGDECSANDPYIGTVDPLFQICQSNAPCPLISNAHFWHISNDPSPGPLASLYGETNVPGVTEVSWLSSYYNAHGVPNAWHRAHIFWTGNGIAGHSPNHPLFRGIKQLYQSGDEAQKKAAMRFLGHVMHLVQDMSMPVHAHRQEHATDDDSLEEWEGETRKGHSGWGDWNGSGAEGGQRARNFFDTHYRSKSGSLPYLLTVPQYKSSLVPSFEAQNSNVYPIFYLMQFTNMRAGWFADDRNNGFNYTRPWHDLPRAFQGLDSRFFKQRAAASLIDNDNGFWKALWKTVCMILLIAVTAAVCVFWFIPFIGPALCLLMVYVTTFYGQMICEMVVEQWLDIHEDNDDDGDLSTIRDQTLPVAYIATATTYCHFFELVDPVRMPAGSCPTASLSGDDPMNLSIGGGVIGLVGNVTVANGGDTKVLSANGTFSMNKFGVTGETYNVVITLQPPGQTCRVVNPTGTITNRDIRNIGVTCATNGDATPPGPVTGLTVTTGNIGMCANFLSWQNPADSDFFGGVIVRNGNHAPVNISDGEVVYNGDIPTDNNLVPEGNFSFPTNFTDSRVDPGKLYYYAIFARDTAVPANQAAPATGSVTTDSSCASNPGCGGVCGGGGGPCFVATASFGESYNLTVLRNFRDNVLLSSSLGTAFVGWYYRVSPPLADFIRDSMVMRITVSNLLMPVTAIVAIYLGQSNGEIRAYYWLFVFAVGFWPLLLIYFRRYRYGV